MVNSILVGEKFWTDAEIEELAKSYEVDCCHSMFVKRDSLIAKLAYIAYENEEFCDTIRRIQSEHSKWGIPKVEESYDRDFAADEYTYIQYLTFDPIEKLEYQKTDSLDIRAISIVLPREKYAVATKIKGNLVRILDINNAQ